MAKVIMVQGTASNVGKSVITAGLCRIFKKDGGKTAPFKSQNMALNSFITKDGKEMGRAQVVQAEAAQISPDVRMNPILLKPTDDRKSQVIVNGTALKNMAASEYYEFKKTLIPAVEKAFSKLSSEFDVVVIEGAGSPVEINLNKDDFVNMGMAKIAKSPVLLVSDIDRGGVFASVVGTIMLLSDAEKSMVKGVIINKFRGDVEILRPGLKMLEEIINVPVVGVVPHMNVKIDDEDSMSSNFGNDVRGAAVDIAVIRLPKISNFTDFNPFQFLDGVSLRYVDQIKDLGNPDLIILPGTKSTMSDLLWLRQSGLEALIVKHAGKGVPIFGICGGLQMLCEKLSDPLSVESGGELSGLSLLPYETVFELEKVREQVSGNLSNVTGIFSGLSGLLFEGYEIHMGRTKTEHNIVNVGNIYGTYIHGIFDCAEISTAIINAICVKKGVNFEQFKAIDVKWFKESQYDILEETLRSSLDMEKIYSILEAGL